MKKKAETTITAEQRREIASIASQIAIEKYRKEAEQAKEERRDKRLHNTKLLMEKYRGFVIHSQSAVYDAAQVRDDFDLEELLDIMNHSSEVGPRELAVVSVQESAAKTRILVHHIDRMLDYFKYCCEHSPKPEDARRYRVIYYSYIAEESEQKTFQQLAEEENVDISTIYKDHRAAIQQMSALIFGYID
ncbi:MAG: hypothetical protein HFE45_11850 [Oscillospiraceae bacterium]|jgi:hypothetical protein|nr:hypothetical protein [Oscillospiraceae bacterium]